jgi:3-deoxy-D-manno-octulosonic-acid transferase
MAETNDVATVEGSLRLGGGFTPSDRDTVIEHFGSLDQRLRSFRADAVELLLAIKERDTPSQRTTLEARIAGSPSLIATSTHTGYDDALIEVRDDLVRQITDLKNKSEPRHNRHLRGD